MAGLYRHPPVWVSDAAGHEFVDVDGHRYLDFNLGDMSPVAGFTHPVLSAVIARQSAIGVQYLLPTRAADVRRQVPRTPDRDAVVGRRLNTSAQAPDRYPHLARGHDAKPASSSTSRAQRPGKFCATTDSGVPLGQVNLSL